MRPDEREASPERLVVLGGEARDDVGMHGDPGDGRACPLDDPGIVGGQVPAAHASQDAVVARLERQVQVRQRPRRAVDPRREQLVVDVLGLDGAEAEALDGRLGQDPPDEAGERERRAGVGAARTPLRPAAVVGADVDPGQDDLAMTGGDRAAHVGKHGLRRERALGAAGRRDDAVRAVERAAVLDLDERARPLDRRAIVRDPVDRRSDHVHARERGERPGHRRVAVGREQRLELGEERGLRVVADQPRPVVDPRERLRPDLDGAAGDDDRGIAVGAPGPPHGRARLLVGDRGHRAGVDEDEVRAAVRVDERHAGLAEEPRRALHLRLVDLAAEVDDRRRAGRHHSAGFVDIRKPISPTADVSPYAR